MCIIEKETLTLEELMDYLVKRESQEKINIERVKKLYNDDESFNNLMNLIIEKDTKRFEKISSGMPAPDPCRILYIIMDIVQSDGEEIEPFDTLTKNFTSISMLYRGWTFSWAHGVGTIISIYNRENELIYRF